MRSDLTAAMIVKNEEANLERCLTSAKLVTNKIVIVDTGSTDRSMEIAKDYGAEVYQHPWTDSFSEARNHALGYVKTKWALSIDADEEIIKATIGALDILDDGISAYLTQIHNAMVDGTESLHHFERLYQPTKIHYKWRVHNEVVIDEGEYRKTGLGLIHHGYAQSEEKLKAKHENTLRLLLMDVKDGGYVLRNVRYLVTTYRTLQRHQDVLDTLADHGHILEDHTGLYQQCMSAAIPAYNALGDNANAKAAGLALLDKFPEALDALFYMGVVYMECKEWDLSTKMFARFMKTRSQLQMDGVDTSIGYQTWGLQAIAFQNIAFCASMKGDVARAALFKTELFLFNRTI